MERVKGDVSITASMKKSQEGLASSEEASSPAAASASIEALDDGSIERVKYFFLKSLKKTTREYKDILFERLLEIMQEDSLDFHKALENIISSSDITDKYYLSIEKLCQKVSLFDLFWALSLEDKLTERKISATEKNIDTVFFLNLEISFHFSSNFIEEVKSGFMTLSSGHMLRLSYITTVLEEAKQKATSHDQLEECLRRVSRVRNSFLKEVRKYCELYPDENFMDIIFYAQEHRLTWSSQIRAYKSGLISLTHKEIKFSWLALGDMACFILESAQEKFNKIREGMYKEKYHYILEYLNLLHKGSEGTIEEENLENILGFFTSVFVESEENEDLLEDLLEDIKNLSAIKVFWLYLIFKDNNQLNIIKEKKWMHIVEKAKISENISILKLNLKNIFVPKISVEEAHKRVTSLDDDIFNIKISKTKPTSWIVCCLSAGILTLESIRDTLMKKIGYKIKAWQESLGGDSCYREDDFRDTFFHPWKDENDFVDYVFLSDDLWKYEMLYASSHGKLDMDIGNIFFFRYRPLAIFVKHGLITEEDVIFLEKFYETYSEAWEYLTTEVIALERLKESEKEDFEKIMHQIMCTKNPFVVSLYLSGSISFESLSFFSIRGISWEDWKQDIILGTPLEQRNDIFRKIYDLRNIYEARSVLEGIFKKSDIQYLSPNKDNESLLYRATFKEAIDVEKLKVPTSSPKSYTKDRGRILHFLETAEYREVSLLEKWYIFSKEKKITLPTSEDVRTHIKEAYSIMLDTYYKLWDSREELEYETQGIENPFQMYAISTRLVTKDESIGLSWDCLGCEIILCLELLPSTNDILPRRNYEKHKDEAFFSCNKRWKKKYLLQSMQGVKNFYQLKTIYYGSITREKSFYHDWDVFGKERSDILISNDDAHNDDAHNDDAHNDDAHNDDAHNDDARSDDIINDDLEQFYPEEHLLIGNVIENEIRDLVRPEDMQRVAGRFVGYYQELYRPQIYRIVSVIVYETYYRDFVNLADISPNYIFKRPKNLEAMEKIWDDFSLSKKWSKKEYLIDAICDKDHELHMYAVAEKYIENDPDYLGCPWNALSDDYAKFLSEKGKHNEREFFIGISIPEKEHTKRLFPEEWPYLESMDFFSPSVVGPSVVGPSVVGPSVVGPSEVDSSCPEKRSSLSKRDMIRILHPEEEDIQILILNILEHMRKGKWMSERYSKKDISEVGHDDEILSFFTGNTSITDETKSLIDAYEESDQDIVFLKLIEDKFEGCEEIKGLIFNKYSLLNQESKIDITLKVQENVNLSIEDLYKKICSYASSEFEVDIGDTQESIHPFKRSRESEKDATISKRVKLMSSLSESFTYIPSRNIDSHEVLEKEDKEANDEEFQHEYEEEHTILDEFKRAIIERYSYRSSSVSSSSDSDDSDSLDATKLWDERELEQALDELKNRYEVEIIAKRLLSKKDLFNYRKSFRWKESGRFIIDLLDDILREEDGDSSLGKEILDKVMGIRGHYAIAMRLVAKDYLSREEVNKPENRDIWEDEGRSTSIAQVIEEYSYPHSSREKSPVMSSSSKYNSWASIDLWDAIKNFKNHWKMIIVAREYLSFKDDEEDLLNWDEYGFEVFERLRLKSFYDSSSPEELKKVWEEIIKEGEYIAKPSEIQVADCAVEHHNELGMASERKVTHG